MALSSTSFKPGNQMFNRERLTGRPEYWTPERIDEIIVSLGEWVQKEDSISMSGWRGYNSMSRQSMDYVRRISPVFSTTYEAAREIVANRLAQKTGNGVHSSVFNLLTPVYDWEVKAHEIEMATIKANTQAEENKEKADAAKQNMERFADQVLSASDRKIADKSIKADTKS